MSQRATPFHDADGQPIPCHYRCGRAATTRDHVIPKGRGGRLGRNRRACVMACERCNNSRKDKPYASYAFARGVPAATIIAVAEQAFGEHAHLTGQPVPRDDLAALRSVRRHAGFYVPPETAYR